MVRFNFERLDVWQKSIVVVGDVYAVTASFPSDEKFGLTNQIRRAATSISANIAEGSGRESKKEFQRFISIAYGSLIEVVSHLHVARTLSYISEEDLNKLLNQLEQIAKMLSGLKKSLNS